MTIIEGRNNGSHSLNMKTSSFQRLQSLQEEDSAALELKTLIELIEENEDSDSESELEIMSSNQEEELDEKSQDVPGDEKKTLRMRRIPSVIEFPEFEDAVFEFHEPLQNRPRISEVHPSGYVYRIHQHRNEHTQFRQLQACG